MSHIHINFEHVNYSYEKSVPILQDITFTAHENDSIGLIGANGVGKSTLLRLLVGLNLDYEGSIRVEEMPVVKEMLPKVREKIGYVFQDSDSQLFMSTVFEDVAFAPRNYGLPEEEVEKRARHALKLVGMDEKFYKQSPFELSGGQKRRVAIAGVMAMEPKILVLDEPAAGLDPEGRDTILSQIRNYHEQTGITVILVSHSMEDIARYANRVLVMSKAKVAMYDTVEKVFARAPELLELGLSVPQVTQVFLMLKAMGMEIDTDVYTVPYAVKTVLKAWNAKHPDKAVPLPQNHKTVQEGGAD